MINLLFIKNVSCLEKLKQEDVTSQIFQNKIADQGYRTPWSISYKDIPRIMVKFVKFVIIWPILFPEIFEA